MSSPLNMAWGCGIIGLGLSLAGLRAAPPIDKPLDIGTVAKTIEQLRNEGRYRDAADYYFAHREALNKMMQEVRNYAVWLSRDLSKSFEELGDPAQAALFLKNGMRLERELDLAAERQADSNRKPDFMMRLVESFALSNLCEEAGDLAGADDAIRNAVPELKIKPTEGISPEFQQKLLQIIPLIQSAMGASKLNDYYTALRMYRTILETMDGHDMPPMFRTFWSKLRPGILFKKAHLEALVGENEEAARDVDEALAASIGVTRQTMANPMAGILSNISLESRTTVAIDTLTILGRTKEAVELLLESKKDLQALTGSGEEAVKANNVLIRRKRRDIAQREARIAMAEGDAVTAAKAWQDCLGFQHELRDQNRPATIGLRQGLAWSSFFSGDRETAVTETNAAHDQLLHLWGNAVTFANERQRLSLLLAADPFSLMANLNLEEELADALIRLKGVALRSVIEERRIQAGREDPAKQPLVTNLMAKRKEWISQSVLEDSPAKTEKMAALELELSAIETAISKQFARTGTARDLMKVSSAETRAALQPADLLIDYIRYWKAEALNRWVDSYGAMILQKAAAPRWVPLGEAARIDSAVETFTRLIGSAMTESRARQLLTDLHSWLITPCLSAADAPPLRLLISPDSSLNFVPYVCLLDEQGRFLVETFDYVKLASASELANKPKSPGTVSMLIVADIDFDLKAGVPNPEARPFVPVSRGGAAGDGDLPNFAPLNNSRAEMLTIREEAAARRWHYLALEGAGATESALRSAVATDPPTILHIATHCERENGIRSGQKGGRLVYGPLMGTPISRNDREMSFATDWLPVIPQSGDGPGGTSLLGLAGANPTFESWRKKIFPPAASDNILTADECAELNLEQTWLVIFNACASGRGAVLRGQGLWGFQRGFALAGAQNVMTTLWSVRDREAMEFMKEYYASLDTKLSPSTSLLRVQKSWLTSRRKGNDIVNAVRYSAPYDVTVRSLPPRQP